MNPFVLALGQIIMNYLSVVHFINQFIQPQGSLFLTKIENKTLKTCYYTGYGSCALGISSVTGVTFLSLALSLNCMYPMYRYIHLCTFNVHRSHHNLFLHSMKTQTWEVYENWKNIERWVNWEVMDYWYSCCNIFV